jgi:putative redox protein
MVRLEWKGGMTFEAEPPSGNKIFLSGGEDGDPSRKGPKPLETLLIALAGCTAMDVISILEKKRQKVTAYRVEVEGDRPPEGTWPRPYVALRVRHVLSGENLDKDAVARAVELSDTKYCSVTATLRTSPEVTSEWVVEE